MKVPTRQEFFEIIEEARLAGDAAAYETWRQVALSGEAGKLLDTCGGVLLMLLVDRRSRFGKFIKSIMNNPLPNVSISDIYYGGYGLDINYLHGLDQQRSVCIAREEAALEILKARLGVEGYVRLFDD